MSPQSAQQKHRLLASDVAPAQATHSIATSSSHSAQQTRDAPLLSTHPSASTKTTGLSYTQLMQQKLSNLLSGKAQPEQGPLRPGRASQPAAKATNTPEQRASAAALARKIAAAAKAAAANAGALNTADPHQITEICEDSCVHAKNGECDDGRNWVRHTKLSYDKVSCDLGTDCSDCGPWKMHGPR